MTLPNYERLGVFYLGREYDPASQQLGDELLYDARDLTTHAVCIGMTGSGKTGLCLSLLEEAAIDGVSAIAIDPKGDIANLLLAFPQLRPEDFRPWVDEGEAARKGKSPEEFAAATAETWRKGLAEWSQDGARIERLRNAAEIAIYTPGSQAGRPLSVLRSFTAPDAGTLADATAFKERIGSSVAGLLALLGIEADPLKSREHILLSAILDAAWRRGESPDLAALIQAVQKPPFDKIGVFDLESFYPARERMGLALAVNGLLAAPGFESWLAGDPPDVGRLLYTAEGKPRISIISIAHLSDAERMFVVTLIASELVAWMRRQPGTTSLRALLYMDEVFGYFPPTAMPPSKLPLLTLMKQARAFGIGVVLATQNPVDIDYKGLGNAGTWFIGRLQTERDKARVIEGLMGSEAAGGLDRTGFETLMSNLTQRTFLMRNVNDDAPVLFRTRWALSYLRGPLTLKEIERVTRSGATSGAPASTSSDARISSTSRDGAASVESASSPGAGVASVGAPPLRSGAKPVVQHDVIERFIATPAVPRPSHYEAQLGARVRAHFVDRKAGLDTWQSHYVLAPVGADGPDWTRAATIAEPGPDFADGPAAEASYAEPPAALLSMRERKRWAASLEDHVLRSMALELWSCPALKLTAASGATEGEFRATVALALREKRDAAIDALRRKYRTRLDSLEERVRRADQKIERERAQASSEVANSALAIGGSLLGALFGGGRRASMYNKASTAARNVGRASKERADVAQAEADAHAVREQFEALNDELEAEVSRLEAAMDPASVPLETAIVAPRKSDIAVEEIALVWCPRAGSPPMA